MRFNTLLVSLLVLFVFTSCDPEIGPAVELECFSDPEVVEILDVVPNPEPKVVFMMEFTGGNCANCPKGAAAVEAILDDHYDTFAPVGMHSTLGGIFGPVSGSTHDFTLDEGTTYFSQFMGIAIPSASIDFFKFPEFQGAVMDPTQVSETGWIDYYNQRATVPSPVNLSVNGSLNASELTVTAEVVYHQDSTEDHFITVYVLESNIIDKQKMPDNSTNDSYEHNHIVRQLLTTTSGSILIGPGENKVAGTKVTRTFNLANLPASWNTENLELVAIVHKGGATLEVLQAAKSKI